MEKKNILTTRLSKKSEEDFGLELNPPANAAHHRLASIVYVSMEYSVKSFTDQTLMAFIALIARKCSVGI